MLPKRAFERAARFLKLPPHASRPIIAFIGLFITIIITTTTTITPPGEVAMADPTE